MMQDATVERILARFNDLENNPDETIAPYLEFSVDGKLYYFTPGGFLYRRESGTEAVEGFFCGYVTDEVWHYRTDNHYYTDDESVGEEPARRSWWRRLFGCFRRGGNRFR
jgi:hypothetical protein